MTINERVSPERLAHIRASYEASRKGYAFIGHPSYNESIAIIDELQKYRAAAEPDRNPVLGYADNYRDMAKRGVESVPIWSVITDLERNIAPLFAAPQVTSVPDKIEPTHEAIKAILPTACPDEYACCVGADMWNACRAAMLSGGTLISEGTTAAPAVQAEPLSVDTLANVLRNAPAAPSDNEGKKRGNSPAIPDGYALVPVEPTSAILDEFDSIIDYGAEDSNEAWCRLLASAWVKSPPAAPKQEAQEVKK